jgi:hypothetical protein
LAGLSSLLTFAEKIMQVHWEHDREEWDPFTILGRFALKGDVSGQIEDDNIILDSWLGGLDQGLLALRSGEQETSIDTLDEPDDIRFRLDGKQVTIAWRNQRLQVSDVEMACASLARQLLALADDLASRPSPRSNETISTLYQQADTLANKPPLRTAQQRAI